MTNPIGIKNAISEINEVILKALMYQSCPIELIEKSIKHVEYITNTPSTLKECESQMKTSKSNLLFYISNIIYNLKTRNDLVLTPDVLRWLCSVWKNFLTRNKAYQELFPTIDTYRISFKEHYPSSDSFIQQLENVSKVKDEYLVENDIDDSPLVKLHDLQQKLSEILNWMRPTYFFLLDFYYERKLKHGEDYPLALNLEKDGLAKFGQSRYTYGDLLILQCQALGILEALYLILKKKKSSRRIVNFNGKQKFLSTPEIYKIYLEKFNAMKKELSLLKLE